MKGMQCTRLLCSTLRTIHQLHLRRY